jgi:hypothetical protein
MDERTQKISPRAKARMAGLFYCISVLSAVLAEAFVRGKMLYAAGLVPVSCFAVATLLLYDIFKPVSGTLSLLALLSNLASLAVEAFELHFGAVNVALVFHGGYCVLIALLIFRSKFLPRILGVPMGLAGLAWLTSLFPRMAHEFHVYTQAAGFAGEGVPMLWLLAMAIDVARWNKQRSAQEGG